jgi:cytochrome P450
MTTAPDRRRATAIPDLPRTRGYESAQEVLRSPRFTSTMHNAHTFEIFGGAVLTLDGPEHRTRRQAERTLFATAARQRYEGVVLDLLRRELDRLQSLAPEGAVVEVASLVRPVFLQVTARIVGIDDVEGPERTERLMRIVTGLRGVAGSDFISGDKDEALARAKAVKEEFRAGFFAESKQRRTGATAEVPDADADLLTLLLRHYPDWSDDDLIRECLFFLAAAGGTQLNAIGHAVVELDRWADGDPASLARLREREFLQRAVSETMRHHPPLPMLVRRAVKDVTLHDGTTVPAGTDIAVDLFSANLDPTVWGADAEAFDPERVAPRGVLEHGVTFAMGPHTCPGRPIAVGDRVNDGDEPPWGLIPQILLELYARGARLDPGRAPEPSAEYTFPVWGRVWLRLAPVEAAR